MAGVTRSDIVQPQSCKACTSGIIGMALVGLLPDTSRMRLSRCARAKQPMASVWLSSHDLQPIVNLMQQRRITDFQIIINQGDLLAQFRCGVQVRFRRARDLELALAKASDPLLRELETDDLELLAWEEEEEP